MKTCAVCRQVKSLCEFGKDKTKQDGINYICRECANARARDNYAKNHEARRAHRSKYYQTIKDKPSTKDSQRRYQIANREKRRIKYKEPFFLWRLVNHYKIDKQHYDSMLESQSGRCAICGDLPPPGKRLNIDHDHVSGKVRGLLCKQCNTVLGFFSDSIELLKYAATYLKQYSNSVGNLNMNIDKDLEESVTLKFNREMNEEGGREKVLDFLCTMAQHIRNEAGVKNSLQNRLNESERDASVFAAALMVELDRAGKPLVLAPERIESLPPGTTIAWRESSSGVVTVELVVGRGRGDC